jgi:hypothetical protein
MNQNLTEALWRICALVKYDERSPGGQAEKLVFFRFEEPMFTVRGMGNGYKLVEAVVSEQDLDAIIKANPDFDFATDNSFTSFSAKQLLQIAQMCVSQMTPIRPKAYASTDEETEMTMRHVCESAGVNLGRGMG